MGAWDHGVFDDDTAYDALDDLKASQEIMTEMERYFDAVIGAEHVGYDEGHYALVSAAVMDSVLNGTRYRCDDEDHFEWIKTLDSFDLAPLRQKAIAAIDAVLSDRSELKELWQENKKRFSAWQEDKISMRERLRS
jgi:hypothetical protein